MFRHIMLIAIAFTLGLLTYYATYSLLSPYSDDLAALVAFGLLFSTPLPLILAVYGKIKWAGRLFVGSWLAYATAIIALIVWATFEAFLAQSWILVLVAGGSTLAIYILHRSGKIEGLLGFLSREKTPKEEPGVQPAIEFEIKPTAEPRMDEAEFELEPRPTGEERADVFDLGEIADSLDSLDCKILLILLTTGSVSSKKDLKLATGATYRRTLSSTKRLQEAGLIDVRKEVIRGKKGAIIRHSINIALNVKEELEPLVRQRMEKLKEWGITEA